MIVDRIRDMYAELALKERNTGWPSGSRFGNCTAALQFKRFPVQSNPERAKPRDMIRFAHGRAEEEWIDSLMQQVLPGLTGLRQEPFYFKVPLDSSQVAKLIDATHLPWGQRIWGTVRPGFVPPYARLEDGRVKLRLLTCNLCTTTGRNHKERPCGKMLGFVIDPDIQAVYAPTFVDWLLRTPESEGPPKLLVVEGKALSNYGFRDLLVGRLGWDRLAQLAGLSAATGLDAMLVAERKETHHLAELEYSRRITFRRLVISKLNGQSEEFFLHPEKRDPDLPADADWDLAHVDNPFEEGHLAAIQENIRRVLLFDGDAGPGSKDVHRQYGPDFHCETCGGKGLQVLAKGTRLPLKKGAKPCEDCGATGNLDRAELGYPCSYCSVVSTCYPMSSLEIDARPHRYINRVEFGKSGLTFTEGPYRA